MAVDLRGVTAVLLPGTGSDDDYVYRAFAAALHDAGAVVVAPPPQAGPADRRLRFRPRQRRADGRHRGGWGVHRRRGRGQLGVGPSDPRGRGAGRIAAVDGLARHRARRAGRQVLGRRAAPGRAGVGDLADARIEPGLARRRIDPVLGRTVAVAARRDGGGVPLRLADVRRAGAADGADGRRRGDRRPRASRWRSALEWVAAAPRAALRTVTLDEMGADPSVLGAACVAALLDV